MRCPNVLSQVMFVQAPTVRFSRYPLCDAVGDGQGLCRLSVETVKEFRNESAPPSNK
jgi:hypothetical protein